MTLHLISVLFHEDFDWIELRNINPDAATAIRDNNSMKYLKPREITNRYLYSFPSCHFLIIKINQYSPPLIPGPIILCFHSILWEGELIIMPRAETQSSYKESNKDSFKESFLRSQLWAVDGQTHQRELQALL